MIVSFRHKGLEALFRTGSLKGIQADHHGKLRRVLATLNAASKPDDIAKVPSYKLHPLKGGLKDYWAVWVNGNWRVTFRFIGTDIELVDYQDYH